MPSPTAAPSGYLADLCRELGMDERSVRKRASEAQTRILHDYSRFTVLTIDRFFQRIVRAFNQELGIDLDYNIELETDSILARSADALIEEILEDKQLERWLMNYVEERFDEGQPLERARRHSFARRRDIPRAQQGYDTAAADQRGAATHRERDARPQPTDQTAACRMRRRHAREDSLGRRRPLGFQGQGAQFRLLGSALRRRPHRRADGHHAQGCGGYRRMVRQGVARGGQGARPRVARAARRDMPPLRRQHIALEFDRAHPRELPQLRAAVGSLPQGNRTVPRGEHHGAQRDQIRAVALHQRRQHAVHIREDRQPLRDS